EGEVLPRTELVRFQEGVDLDEIPPDLLPDRGFVEGGFPESVLALAVVEGKKLRKAVQFLVDGGHLQQPAILLEVGKEPGADGVELLFLELQVHGDRGGLPQRCPRTAT